MDAIICTCGTNLGSIIPLWDLLTSKIKKAYLEEKLKDIPIENVAIHQSYELEFGALFEPLNITLSCCKKELLGKTKPMASSAGT